MSEELKIKIGADIKNVLDKYDTLKKETKTLDASLAKVAKVSAVAFAGFATAIGLAVNESAKLETIKTSFQVMTGSVSQANKVMNELLDLSSRTPFQFEQIADAGQKLLAFGFEAEALPDLITRIGDVSAASGKDVGSLAVIFGQVAAAGKLTGERLNQLLEAGIPILDVLAKATDKPKSAIRDMVSKGEIDFKIFERAFNSLSEEGGLAFKGMEKQSQTLAGKISTLKDNFTQFSARIGDKFAPVMKVAVDALTSFFIALKGNQDLVNLTVSFLAAGAALSALGVAIPTVIIALGALRTAMISLGVVTNGLKLAMISLVGATGIGLVVIAITEFALNWEAASKRAIVAWQGFVIFMRTTANAVGNILYGILNFDPSFIKKGVENLKSGYINAWQVASQEIKAKAVEAEQEKQNDTTEVMTAGEQARLDKLSEFEALKDKVRRRLTSEGISYNDQITAQENEKLLANYQTRDEAEKAFYQQKLQNQIDSNNRSLANAIQYGQAYANIYEAVHSAEVSSFQQGTRSLVALQGSRSSTLRGIGKAFALTDIAINTAKGAIAAYSSLAAIPFVGPFLGFAAAGAVIAYGVEQAGNVLAANTGGMVPGNFSAGGDSVPAILTPGETIVPAKNYDELINGAIATRGGGENAAGSVKVELSLKDNLIEFIETKIVERQNLQLAVLT